MSKVADLMRAVATALVFSLAHGAFGPQTWAQVVGVGTVKVPVGGSAAAAVNHSSSPSNSVAPASALSNAGLAGNLSAPLPQISVSVAAAKDNAALKRTDKMLQETDDKSRPLDALYSGRARGALSDEAPPVSVDGYALPDLQRYSISPKQAAAGVKALRKIFAGEGPARILVNRNADDALRVLTGGDFPTIHTIRRDRPDLPPETRETFDAVAARRRGIERRLGTFGEGRSAGRTVYGSVHLGDRVGPERFLQEIIQGMGKRARRTKQTQGFYLAGGAVTFVMKPAALEKATFLPGDSFLKLGAKITGAAHLAEVAMAALARIASGHAEDSELRKILGMPLKARREALWRALTSDIFQIDYIEAQLRRPTIDDVDHILTKKEVVDWPWGYLPDPRAGSHAAALKKVRELAERRGIPIIESSAELLPSPRRRWAPRKKTGT
ncbi:MAG: hypothetical protein AAB268_10135 [Elusimicrobiota bacterium]